MKRSLATVLFTDIVASTERATKLGDAGWRGLLQRHHALVRGLLRRFGGREVATAGDGFLAIFEQPAAAIACACAIRDGVRHLGIEIRGGLHLGELEQTGGSVGGIAVHIGARVAAHASPGEVLVSRTVRDALEGAGFGFEERGSQVLKGVRGTWDLYAVNRLPPALEARAVARGRLAGVRRPSARALALVGVLALSLAVLFALAVRRGASSGSDDGRERATPASASHARRSIAILPFENVGGRAEEEYFSDGMTEEVIHALTRVEGLRVASRTSSFAFKNSDLDVRQVGERLDVATVLEGSVRLVGDRLRVHAQLVDAVTGYNLWAESYDREVDDVFAIQDEISDAIASTLEVKLAAGPRAARDGRSSRDLEAYRAYLRGRYFWSKRTAEGLRRSIAEFNRAIEIDPTYARAYAGLADAYIILGNFSLAPPRIAYPRARAAAEKALEIEPELAEAWVSRAFVEHLFDRDWTSAERDFRRAIALEPGYGPAHQWYGVSLVSRGRFDEGLAEARRARDTEPLSLIINAVVGWLSVLARQPEAAIEACLTTLEMDSTFFPAHRYLGAAYEQQRRYAEAIAAFRSAAALSGESPGALADLGHALALAGKRDAAWDIARRLERAADSAYVSGFDIAQLYAGLGEDDRALDWLERAHAEGDPWLVMLGIHPRFDALRSQPRFQRLLESLDRGVPRDSTFAFGFRGAVTGGVRLHAGSLARAAP